MRNWGKLLYYAKFYTRGIACKESTGLTPDEMKRMVHDVNVSEVRPEELLSFKIFRYDGRKLSVVNEERQEISQAKEK